MIMETASTPKKKQSFSYSPPWEPEISSTTLRISKIHYAFIMGSLCEETRNWEGVSLRMLYPKVVGLLDEFRVNLVLGVALNFVLSLISVSIGYL
jgi:hypothetical protein